VAVVISSDLVLSAQAGEVQPLTHARIMYQNLVPDAEVTGATESAGFEADATQSYSTYDRWLPTEIPATITYDFGELKDFDYIFIASHNLGSSAAAILPEYSLDGETWDEFSAERIPSNDSALAFLNSEVTGRYMRLTITSATTIPVIGVVMCGVALAMERAIYGGHTPVTLSRQTEMRPSQSEGGQWLGRSVVRKGYSTSYSWSNLTAAWYRANFDPFVKQARFQPFGIAWRPETFPDEVVYAWTNGDIAPSNTGTRNLMSVGMSIIGYDAGDL